MTTRPQGAPRPILSRPSGNVRFGGFIGEIISELRKVVWPTREEATRLTVMVIIVSVTVGVALGLIDIGFSALVRQVLIG
jgi:preprotein translocase subunit SecE